MRLKKHYNAKFLAGMVMQLLNLRNYLRPFVYLPARRLNLDAFGPNDFIKFDIYPGLFCFMSPTSCRENAYVIRLSRPVGC